MENLDILCIGSATMDFIARPSKTERIDINHLDGAEHLLCLTFASKTLLDDLNYQPGGSAANSASAMALLGARPKLVTTVGDDFFGDRIVSDLQRRGVGTEHVVRMPKKASSVGISLLSASGEKSTLVYRGVNDLLAPSHLPEKAVRDCDAVLVTSMTSRLNYSLFLRAIHLARKFSKKLVFAPSITMLKRFPRRLSRLHEKFDLCVMNYEEGMYYNRKTGIREVLRAIPGRARVITKDRDGAYAFDGASFYHVPAYNERVVDTTGAGDAFTGALTVEYCQSGNLGRAISAGAAMAAIKLTRMGPRINLTQAQTESELEKFKKKLRVSKPESGFG